VAPPVFAAAVLASLLAGRAAAPAAPPDWSRPRELPSLVRLWSNDLPVCRATLVDGVLHAVGGGRIVALDAQTGVVRGERPFAGPCDDTTLAQAGLADGQADGRERTLPSRDPDDCARGYGVLSKGLSWDLLGAPHGSDFECRAIRRYSRRTGRPLWRTELPGGPAAAARWKDVVFVQADPGQGRGYVVALDWATGAFRRAAYGLADVDWMYVHGDRLLFAGQRGIVAVAADRFGPPDGRTIPIADAVREILDHADDEAYARVELLRLGAEALPVLAAGLSTMDDARAAVAASALAAGGHRPAGPLLARRLAARLASTGARAEDQRAAFLGALGGTGGPAEVDLVARIAEDASQTPRLRTTALHALAGIGSAAAADVIARVLDPPRPTVSWWRPPVLDGDLAAIGRPVSTEELMAALERDDDAKEYGRLVRLASAARAPLPDGGVLIVFTDGWLGNSADLWAARVGPDGALGPSRFLGVRRPGAACSDECRLAARMDGARLEIRRTDVSADPITADLDAVDRDSDGDGLTDPVEARLTTDPRRADTDGDGTDDAIDRNPATAPRRPEGEEQEIADDLFRQLFVFDRGPHALLVVASRFPLEWTGRQGPTLTIAPEALEDFKRRTGARPLVFGAGPVTDHMYHAAPHLEPGERDHGYGYDASSTSVVVGKVGRRWVIRRVYRSIAR
jgi:hypothetical protein